MAYRLTQYRLHLAWLTVPEARRYCNGVLHSSTHVYMLYLCVRTYIHNMIQYTCIISTPHTNIAKSKPGILQANQQHIMATSCQMSICRCLSAKHATTTPRTFIYILNIKITNVRVQISIRPIFYLFLFSLPCSFQADGIYIIYTTRWYSWRGLTESMWKVFSTMFNKALHLPDIPPHSNFSRPHVLSPSLHASFLHLWSAYHFAFQVQRSLRAMQKMLGFCEQKYELRAEAKGCQREWTYLQPQSSQGFSMILTFATNMYIFFPVNKVCVSLSDQFTGRWFLHALLSGQNISALDCRCSKSSEWEVHPTLC